MASPGKNVMALIYHCSLFSDVRTRLNCTRGAERRVAISVFCAAKLLRKHRLMSTVQHELGLTLRNNRQTDNKSRQTRCSRFAVAHSKRNLVQAFFQQDDVSRPTAGKKETVTKCKQQKQKRFLLHPVSDLHKRFCASHPDVKISQSTFALLKPFWVKKSLVFKIVILVCASCTITPDYYMKNFDR